MVLSRRFWTFFPLAAAAWAGPILGTNPAIPANLQLTTFATGINYPYGMHVLPDGSLLVATSNPTTGSNQLFNSSLQVLRFTDVNQDGVADGPGTPVYNGSAGPATGMSGAGNLVAVASGTNTGSAIHLLQASSGGSLTPVGSLTFTYPGFWWHDSHAVAVREVPNQSGDYELVFNVGSEDNNVSTTSTVGVAGLVSATLNADSLYVLRFSLNGNTASAGPLTQLATGLRNAFGLGFAPNGDLYLADNGIDTTNNTQLSADELNFLSGAAFGSSIVNFGFPGTYIRYSDGVQVGSTGTLPLAAFRPVNGARSEGPAGLTLAPSGFPAGLNNGVFIGFHGVGSASGAANPENPVIYLDLATNQYFHFLLGQQAGQGHLNSLAASTNALFVADLSTADFDTRGAGAIYRIAALADVPEPASAVLIAAGLCLISVCFPRRIRLS